MLREAPPRAQGEPQQHQARDPASPPPALKRLIWTAPEKSDLKTPQAMRRTEELPRGHTGGVARHETLTVE
jgi:hypothetical protein